MNYIAVMKENLSIDDKTLKKYEQDLKWITTFLDGQDIVIPEFFHVPFCNHIIMLLERLSNNECTSLDNQEMIQEIDEENMELAKEFLTPYFEKYQVQPNPIEEALIAIYLQAAQTME